MDFAGSRSVTKFIAARSCGEDVEREGGGIRDEDRVPVAREHLPVRTLDIRRDVRTLQPFHDRPIVRKGSYFPEVRALLQHEPNEPEKGIVHDVHALHARTELFVADVPTSGMNEEVWFESRHRLFSLG